MTDVRAEITGWMMALWRRRWLALGLSWALCVAGWIGVILLPDRYEAIARVHVDTDTLLGPLLKNMAVQNDLHRQVALMQRTLLARPNLQQVMVATDLNMQVHSAGDEQAMFAMLEKSTKITAQGSDLFAISYTGSKPALARDIVQALITVLVESNTGQNRTDMEKARGFIEQQIKTYEAQLKGIEARMAEFKAKHVSELPAGGGESFTSRLELAHKAKLDAQTTLGENKARAEQLRNQLKTVPQYNEVESAPQMVMGGNDPVRTRLVDAQGELNKLKQRFTPKHPDIVALEKEIADLNSQLKDSKNSRTTVSGRSRLSNPVYEQLQMRVLDAEQAVDQAQRRLAQADEEETRLVQLAGSAPAIEAQWSDLTREYGVQHKQYEELLGRRESARISQAVENSSNKIQFRIVELPVLPVKPVGPNRLLFATGVLVAAIGLGIGAALLTHLLEQPFSSAEALTERFRLPVLGRVSRIPDPGDRARQRIHVFRFSLASGGLLLAFAAMILVPTVKAYLHDEVWRDRPAGRAELQVFHG